MSPEEAETDSWMGVTERRTKQTEAADRGRMGKSKAGREREPKVKLIML